MKKYTKINGHNLSKRSSQKNANLTKLDDNEICEKMFRAWC